MGNFEGLSYGPYGGEPRVPRPSHPLQIALSLRLMASEKLSQYRNSPGLLSIHMEKTMKQSNQSLLGDLEQIQPKPQGLLSVPVTVKKTNRSTLSKEAKAYQMIREKLWATRKIFRTRGLI